MADERKRLTVPDLKARKKASEKVGMVSVPDFPLVLAGAFTVAQAGQSTTYRPGEVFAVASGQAHAEEVGAERAQILVGRKY
jgi:quercetin dioxygenase-like cupin family protein